MCSLWNKLKNVSNRTITLITFIMFVILIVTLVASVISEWHRGDSLLGNYLRVHNIKCPVFIQAPSILEVIKIVGVSGVLIGWIYANMDKTMLGLTYSDILHSQFRFNSLFSIIHIISILSCVAVSSAGLSESSILSLAITLIGFLYQWVVFYRLILNSEKCVNMAKLTWDKRISKNDKLETNLLCLAKTLPTKDSQYYQAHLSCLAKMFVRIIENSNSTKQLSLISQAWNVIFVNADFKNELILQELTIEILKTNNSADAEKFLCEIISGYIVSQISEIKSASKYDNMNYEFFELAQRLRMFVYRLSLEKELGDSNQNVKTAILTLSNCINTNIHLLLWVYFQEGFLYLTSDLLKILPVQKRDENFEQIIQLLFRKHNLNDFDKLEKEIKIARIQLNKRLEAQGE